MKTPKGARRQAAWRMWRLMLIVFLNGVVNMSLFFDLENAFLMSLVVCPEPEPHGGVCPHGSKLIGENCSAEPNTSPDWSYSIHCPDKRHVLNAGRQVGASLQTVGHVGSFFAVIFLGPLVDLWGRKQVMILALCGSTLRAMLQMTSSYLTGHETAQRRIILAGMGISSVVNNFLPAMRAMAADLSERTPAGRSAAFAAIGFSMASAIACGFAGGFFVLKMNLTNYGPVWLGATVGAALLVILAVVLLKETGGHSVEADCESESGTDISGSSADEECRFRPWDNVWNTCGIFKTLLQDRLLRQLVLLSLLLAVGKPADHLGRMLLLGPMHYSQAGASLLGVVMPALSAVGNAVVSPLVGRVGSYSAFGVALAFTLLGQLLVGLCMPFAALRQSLFWLGIAFIGTAFGMVTPILQSIVSVRVDLEHQGMLFTLLHLVDLIGSMLGIQIFVKRLFNSSWEGWKAGTAFFAASGIALVCLVWLAILSFTVRARPIEPLRESDGSDEDTIRTT